MPATFATQDTIRQIADEHRAWSTLLRSFTEPDWDCPTGCEGWTIHHLVAHVVSGIEFYRESLDNALVGDSSPLWQDPMAGRLERMDRAFALTRPQLVDAFDKAARRLDESLQGVRDEDAERLAWHRGAGVWNVDRLIGTRLFDSALHRWDLLKGFESNPPIDPARFPFLLRWLTAGIARYFDPAAGSGDDCTWRFNLTAPVSSSLTIAVEGDRVRAYEGADGAANVESTADPTALILVMFRRISLDEALSAGSFSNIRGRDGGLADLVARLKPII